MYTIITKQKEKQEERKAGIRRGSVARIKLLLSHMNPNSLNSIGHGALSV